MYVSEISSPKWRGTLGSCLILCLTFGIIYIYIIGALLPGYPGSWKIFSAWCAAPQILGMFLTFEIMFEVYRSILMIQIFIINSHEFLMSDCYFLGFILLVLAPESPYHLISKKKHSKATEVVALLNGRDDILIKDVIDDIEKYLEQGNSPGNISLCDKLHTTKTKDVPVLEEDSIHQESRKEIIERISENKSTEPFLDNIEFNRQENKGFIKIVFIVIGLFFFTRLCGK